MAGVAHPPIAEVPLGGDLAGVIVKLKPWVMGQRAELRPKVAALLLQVAQLSQGGPGATLIDLFLVAEEEVAGVVRASVPLDTLSAEQWDSMLWEDLPALAQAIWDLNIQREDGGGVVGKLTAAMGPMLAQSVAASVKAARENGSNDSATPTSKTPTTLRPAASASSRTDGETTLSA